MPPFSHLSEHVQTMSNGLVAETASISHIVDSTPQDSHQVVPSSLRDIKKSLFKPGIIRPNAPTPYHSPTTSETPTPTNSQSHPLLYPSPAPQVQAPLTPPTEQHPPGRRPPRAQGQAKKGACPARAAAAQPPPEAAAAAAESLPELQEPGHRAPRRARSHVVLGVRVRVVPALRGGAVAGGA